MKQELSSFLTRLKQQLELIEKQMLELLDASSIKESRRDRYVFTPNYYWGEADEVQRRLQMKLNGAYSTWYEKFCLSISNATEEIKKEVEETHEFVTSWIEKKSSFGIPSTIREAKTEFKEKIQVFYELINMLDNGKKDLILVLDTNALIKVPEWSQYSKVVRQDKYTIIIPPTVLGQLDRLKVMHHDANLKEKVSSVIRRIKGLRQQGNLLQGVTVNKTVTVKMLAAEPNFKETLHWLDPSNEDDRIIASVLKVQCNFPTAIVVLVTSDINLQNKAEMANLPFLEPSEEDV